MLDNVINFNRDRDARSLLSEAKFFEGYSRWNDVKNRYETWDEAVERVMNMHRKYYKDKMTPELSTLIDEAEAAYKDKLVLGAQRALQFGGEQILANPMRMYNCSSTYADRAAFFGEYFHTLLCGAGVGVSVQKVHTKSIPKIQNRTKQAKIFVPEDSIEGWADCADVLMSSYFVGGGKHPEYEGRRVYFDLSKIRPKGSIISGGFKAPGPEPLRRALDKIEHLLQGLILKGFDTLEPIHIYDISMHLADAVLSGGVRRSATIFLFDIDDEDMMNAKTGNWFIDNPQRARSNNSAVVLQGVTTKEQFDNLFERTRQFGEPGFIFLKNQYIVYNPCVEVGMIPHLDGISGFQGCNLCEINGSRMISLDVFIQACRAAAILGTLQAGYTNFKFLSPESKKIFDREALLGVSVTGWMNNPDVLLNEENLIEGAKVVLDVNEVVAKLIGINISARTTNVKPSGNASVLLKTASGIHGEHSPLYIRNVQMNKETEVAQLIRKTNPYMVEESVWSANKSDYVISFPVISPKQSIFKKDLFGINLLEKVKLVQNTWVEAGTRVDRCVDPTVRHNVSNTVTVLPDQWEEVRDYLYENQESFSGVSLLSSSGDYDYNQAPMTEVLTEEQIVAKYGRGAMFASGLIVDAMTGFDNLWDAISIASMETDFGDKEKADARAEWIRRFKKYADNYFRGNLKQAEYCLKAVYILHKWVKIQQNFVSIDFANELSVKKYTDVDTMASASCLGGVCEI
jgi:ribonucleoside-triphosphate reductase (thioredoxin)